MKDFQSPQRAWNLMVTVLQSVLFALPQTVSSVVLLFDLPPLGLFQFLENESTTRTTCIDARLLSSALCRCEVNAWFG